MSALPVKAHEFHDTRYRRIEYWFDATTRFREFLPPNVLTDDRNGKRVPSETKSRSRVPRTVTWIPSSAPPPAPHVLYVVPTFGWTREHRRAGQALELAARRRTARLSRSPVERIGLRRDARRACCRRRVSPATRTQSPRGAPYKNYVTQWGNDPIWESPFVPGIAPARDAFPLARTAPDPTGAWLPPDAPPARSDQRPGAFNVTGLRPPSPDRASMGSSTSRRTTCSTMPIRQLWYCDIEIIGGASYFPFIRLALARYQPISSRNAHLSNVVLADIIALTR